LPIEEPVRVEAGIYTLEARLPGHYPVTRSVALAGGTLVREALTLTPVGKGDVDGEPPPPVGRVEAEPESRGASWLTWTFGGLAVAAGIGTALAWSTRERHVENWNDDSQCLRAGQTRGEVCASERDSGDRAETWMWIAGAATGAFTVASVISFWADSSGDATEPADTAFDCGIGLGQLSCAGRF
jgi:hypothetical protein